MELLLAILAGSLVAAGSYPDADVLAQKMVGRIVCDRLR